MSVRFSTHIYYLLIVYLTTLSSELVEATTLPAPILSEFQYRSGHRLVLIQIFRGFPQPLQKNPGILPQNRPRPLRSESFQVH
jgi:hypothetical protein